MPPAPQFVNPWLRIVREHAMLPAMGVGLRALPGPPTVAISLLVRRGHEHPSLSGSAEMRTKTGTAALPILACASDAASGATPSPASNGHDARRHGGRPRSLQVGHPFASSAWKMFAVRPTNE